MPPFQIAARGSPLGAKRKHRRAATRRCIALTPAPVRTNTESSNNEPYANLLACQSQLGWILRHGNCTYDVVRRTPTLPESPAMAMTGASHSTRSPLLSKSRFRAIRSSSRPASYRLENAASTWCIPPGVTIVGGFAPELGATTLADVDPWRYRTVLTGDVLANDDFESYWADGSLEAASHLVDNACHVVTIAPNDGDPAHLYGLVIRAGFSAPVEGSPINCPGDRRGAGILALGAVTIERCVVESNVAGSNGGGLAATSAGVTLRESLFRRNRSFGDGGAAWVDDHPFLVRQCEFNSNMASNGAALRSEFASVHITSSMVLRQPGARRSRRRCIHLQYAPRRPRHLH